MLNPTPTRRPVLGRAPAAIVLVASVAMIGTALPAQAATPLPAQDASASQASTQSGEASLFGRIVDGTGAVVPGVEIRVARAGEAGRRAVTDPSGSYQLQRLTAGKYVVETSLPGFAPTQAVVEVPDTGRVEHSVMLDLGSLQETITIVGTRGTSRPPRDPVTRVAPAPPGFSAPKIVSVPAPPTGSGLPVRVGGAIKAPAKLADVRPVYPAAAQKAGIEGWVILRAVIDTQGAVKTVDVVRSVDPDLTTPAIAAVRQWKFSPTLLNGGPTDVQMTVNVNFVLE